MQNGARAGEPTKARRRTNWIVLDPAGNVHARIHDANYGMALGIARTVFPEIEGVRIAIYAMAWRQLREEADRAILLTPEICANHGVTPQLCIEWEAHRLQRHFRRRNTVPGRVFRKAAGV
jgi:hypothetical protein